MYTKSLSDSVWELLQKLNDLSLIKDCYLGGGTGLAIQLGHRISDDLDFFCPESFDEFSFLTEIKSVGSDIRVINQNQNQLELMIDEIKVDLIREQIPLIFPPKLITPELPNLKIADPRDIGRMKIISIGSRGSKKDFIDLYCLTREIIPLESLLMLVMEEKGIRYSKLLFLKGLVDFEEADEEGELSMIWKVSWEEVKRRLEEEVRQIAKKIPTSGF